MANILFVAAENDALPNGKVGGIADVVRDVPQFLATQQQGVDVITPSYGFHSTQPYAEHVGSVSVSFRGKPEQLDLYRLAISTSNEHVQQWVLEHPYFAANGAGTIYYDDGPNRPFASDANKFALFCIGVAELVTHHWFERIDILHLHDWHAALVPVLAHFAPQYHPLIQKQIVYTIHNLALQGIRPLHGDESSLGAWFPELPLEQDTVIDPRYRNCINPTRAAINLANKVHAVSPTYATEIVKPSDAAAGFIGGEGLELDLQKAEAEGRLVGILNGTQYQETVKWGDYVTAALSALKKWHKSATASSAEEVAHQLATDRLLQWKQQSTSMESNKPPNETLVTSIGRLTSQKVALLVTEVDGEIAINKLLDVLANYNSKLVILGSGDKTLAQTMSATMAEKENFLFLNGYDTALSDAIYSAGDLFLMPSSFEPCGISQLLALQAGQPCFVHGVGGLNDTIVDNKTGFIFYGNSPQEQVRNMLTRFEEALAFKRHSPEQWLNMVESAKSARFEWPEVIKEYREKLYG
ncbi:glycogen synthase [Thalassotalea euphylliae]|uniref:glycogen synthase n=1 Tax=Thalassotalea euphylliae TaxID=1655234 RepID=UPI003637DB68